MNQNHVLVDHTWLLRGTGWTTSTSDTGLVVNGDDVTVLGLFVEHHQKLQTVWNGNGGRTIFMECEAPYDAPSQMGWMNGSENGYPCYMVGNGVVDHTAIGPISWTLFMSGATIYAHSSIKSPATPNVKFTSIAAGTIKLNGGFEHVINDSPVNTSGPTSFLSGLSVIHQVATVP